MSWGDRHRPCALILGAALAGTALPAHAAFIVCNRSFDVVNVAIGRESGNEFRTDGWWTIGTNQCARVIKGTLENRYVYIYATDVFGKPLLEGHTEMCVGPKKFSIMGIGNCWQRGTIAAPFLEVDTQSAENWTFFLRQPGSKQEAGHAGAAPGTDQTPGGGAAGGGETGAKP